jgi:hypothetical protein
VTTNVQQFFNFVKNLGFWVFLVFRDKKTSGFGFLKFFRMSEPPVLSQIMRGDLSGNPRV